MKGCLELNANSSYFFDGGYLYLKQCLPRERSGLVVECLT